MSHQPVAPQAEVVGGLPATIPASWKFTSIVSGIMVILAMIGVGLTTGDKANARMYWMILVPVYGALCIATAWMRSGFDKASSAVVRQILHWAAVAGAVSLEFLTRNTGEESSTAAGLNALMILSLGCVLAGVHLEWHFAVVGLVLATTLIVVAKAEQYAWLVFVVGAAVLVAFVLLYRAYARRRTPAPH